MRCCARFANSALRRPRVLPPWSARIATPAKVVDASALGALLFGEPDGAAVAARLQQATLIAPALLPFEVADICLKKMRRHPDRRAPLLAAFGMLDQMEVGILDVDHAKCSGSPNGLVLRRTTPATSGSRAGQGLSW